MTILMVGVGAMGSAMAARLMERGHEIVGVDPFLVEEGQSGATSDGVRVIHSLAQASRHEIVVDEVLVFVRMADQVVSVLETMDADSWFDTVPATILSTLSPADARDIAERFGARRPIAEAPVSGGVAGARAGTLTVLLTGAVGPWLEDAAATVFRFDGYGLPAAAKLLNNALAAANANNLVAALGQASTLGLDPGQMLDVVQVSSGGGWIAENFGSFPVDLLWKDYTLLRKSGHVRFPRTDDDTDLIRIVEAARASIRGE